MDGSEASRDIVLALLATRGHLRGDADPLLDDLVAQGYAIRVGDSVVLTSEGAREARETLLLGAEDPRRAALTTYLPRFGVLDRRVRELCTSWQLLPDGTPNPHHPDYDAAVRRRLEALHRDALAHVHELSDTEPHLREYADLLSEACAAFLAGDGAMLASPVRASYHTVWMWLHQDLRLRLGLAPEDDAT